MAFPVQSLPGGEARKGKKGGMKGQKGQRGGPAGDVQVDLIVDANASGVGSRRDGGSVDPSKASSVSALSRCS